MLLIANVSETVGEKMMSLDMQSSRKRVAFDFESDNMKVSLIIFFISSISAFPVSFPN